MQQPLHDADTLFEDLLQDLPAETLAMAVEFRAFARARKVKSPCQLLRLVLLYCGLDHSLRETAAIFTALDASITDSSVAQRLAACEPWLTALLPRLLPKRPSAIETPLRILVVDASTVEAPGKGGRLRLHLCVNLLTLQIVSLRITTAATGERLTHYALAAGEVVLADRGYGYRDQIVEALSNGAHLITRVNAHNLPLGDREGRALDLLAALDHQQPETVRSLEVEIVSRDGRRAWVWLHAYRLGPDAAERARRRCRRKAKSNGTTVQARTLALAEWVLLLTSVAPEALSGEQVLELYRARWQIELAIKRFKSVLDIDALRARAGSTLGTVWMHGKMAYALMIERRARRQWGLEWAQFERPRPMTGWRIYGLVAVEVMPLITGSAFWRAERRLACVHALRERPRSRAVHRLSDGGRALLNTELAPASTCLAPAA